MRPLLARFIRIRLRREMQAKGLSDREIFLRNEHISDQDLITFLEGHGLALPASDARLPEVFKWFMENLPEILKIIGFLIAL